MPSSTTADVVDADLVAAHTGQPRMEVRAVLAGLASRAMLSTQRMVRCPDGTCRTFTPADRVERARVDGDPEPCDGQCGQDLAAVADLEVVDTYQLVARPLP
jgi:hypothetical protein